LPKVDLHIHSTASDGRLSPQEIVYRAVELGITIIAIADHDTVAGIAPALAAAKVFPELKVIPAIEISTDVPGDEVHVLGYFIDYTNPHFISRLESMRRSRIERAQKMVAKLKGLGVNIEWERVQHFAGGSTIGRPHIAQAMLEKSYIGSISEAFAKYIGRNGPAYVEREKMTPAEAVKLLLDVNGLPVLAHPLTIRETEAMIMEMRAAGMVGIEVYYKDYGEEQRNSLRQLAQKHHLIATGGSDYHGLEDNEIMIGDAGVPLVAAEQLLALAEHRALKSVNPKQR
jgi:hypothetical protein